MQRRVSVFGDTGKMDTTTMQATETKRKPAGRVRLHNLPQKQRELAFSNLLFHRDTEDVSERFSVRRTDLLEMMIWHLYDQIREKPKGPATVLKFRERQVAA